MSIPASGSFETHNNFNTFAGTTTEPTSIPIFELQNRIYVEPDKHEEHCKENKLRISVSRKAMFSKKGKKNNG